MRVWIKRQDKLCLLRRLSDEKLKWFLTICNDMISYARKRKGLPELEQDQEITGTMTLTFDDEREVA